MLRKIHRMANRYQHLYLIFSLAISQSLIAGTDKSQAYRSCLQQTANHFQINPLIIDAIIKTESDYDANAININKNGSTDLGLMQINLEIWLPVISKLGYSRDSLRSPCTNIFVGGWILAQEMRRFGNTWRAVGAYNAGPAASKEFRRLQYARRVFAHINQ